MRGAGSVVLGLLLLGVARADEPAADKPVEDEPAKPYVEGWHGGSQPGEHVAFRADLWAIAQQRTALELGRGPRTLPVDTVDLGQPGSGTAGGLGLEVNTGKLGWLSVDYWGFSTRGQTTLARAIDVADTVFPAGDLVASTVDQLTVKIRDGLDIRYRIPIDGDTWLDLNFGPSTALVVRSESLYVRSLAVPRNDGGRLLAVSLVPGGRAGVDLHVRDGFVVRIGSDFDVLPHLGHNPLSFTREPSLDAWADARAFAAVRLLFIEVSFGYRYYRSLASGGQVRQAYATMRGMDVEVACRF